MISNIIVSYEIDEKGLKWIQNLCLLITLPISIPIILDFINQSISFSWIYIFFCAFALIAIFINFLKTTKQILISYIIIIIISILIIKISILEIFMLIFYSLFILIFSLIFVETYDKYIYQNNDLESLKKRYKKIKNRTKEEKIHLDSKPSGFYYLRGKFYYLKHNLVYNLNKVIADQDIDKKIHQINILKNKLENNYIKYKKPPIKRAFFNQNVENFYKRTIIKKLKKQLNKKSPILNVIPLFIQTLFFMLFFPPRMQLRLSRYYYDNYFYLPINIQKKDRRSLYKSDMKLQLLTYNHNYIDYNLLSRLKLFYELPSDIILDSLKDFINHIDELVKNSKKIVDSRLTESIKSVWKNNRWYNSFKSVQIKVYQDIRYYNSLKYLLNREWLN
ncbi:MAG: hypothetical protein ISS82_01775 [Nanoarchaeota archaeon]|nr:hypothetical protein [Nanoarchaeota archaeon]